MKTLKYTAVLLLLAASAALPLFAAKNDVPSLTGIEKIDIESHRTDMNERTNVTVRTGSKEQVTGRISSWTVSGTKLRIRPAGDIVITLLPGHGLRDLEIEILSGNIRVDGITALEELETVATSGTTTLRNTEASEEIETTSTTGRIILENVTAPEISMNSVSGSLEFRGEAEKLEASSLLGSIGLVTGKTPCVTVNTTHGTITIETGNKAPRISFDSLFGIYTGPESTTGKPDMTIRAHSLNSPLTVTMI